MSLSQKPEFSKSTHSQNSKHSKGRLIKTFRAGVRPACDSKGTCPNRIKLYIAFSRYCSCNRQWAPMIPMCRSPQSFHVSSFEIGTDSLINYYFDMRKSTSVHKAHLLNYEHHFDHGTLSPVDRQIPYSFISFIPLLHGTHSCTVSKPQRMPFEAAVPL